MASLTQSAYPTIAPRPPAHVYGVCAISPVGQAHEAELDAQFCICARHLLQIQRTRHRSVRRQLWRSFRGALWLLWLGLEAVVGGLAITGPFWLAALYLHLQGVL